ncbi:unnamed protein product [Clonostachys rosea]|uniref:Major facilitator superfamily (MFS) profile domain-containing protein n=1 Tax=Bionectria ochroleuca TaxID=29856 RepID=A0ABY6UHH3_BIOOC|nr:unnamed protein product [Clonostachys rosea]
MEQHDHGKAEIEDKKPHDIYADPEDLAVSLKHVTTSADCDLPVVNNMENEDKVRDHGLVTDASGHVFLLPRPSRSPDDPLNWSQKRKWTVLVIICWYYALALSASQFLSFVIPQLAESYPDEPFANINLLFTITVPLAAPADIIWFVCAFKWGMRPTAVFAVLLFFISNLIGVINPYLFDQFLAARIIAGFGVAPSDVLNFIMVESFTFVHERGIYMAILASVGGALNSLLCIATTWITINTSLRGVFLFYTIGSFVSFAGLWLLFPETSIHRNDSDLVEPLTKEEYREWRKTLGRGESSGLLLNPFAGHKNIRKHSLMDVAKWLWLALRNPVMWWFGIFQVVLFGGFSAVATYFATLLESPPWSWAPANVSFINFVVIPMAVIGVLVGILSDWSIIKLAQRRGGSPKLEDRLLMMPFPAIFGIAGLVGFGAMAQSFYADNAPHWFTCVFIYFLIMTAFCVGLQLSAMYFAGSVSSEHGLAMLTMLSAIRDLGSFGLSYGIVLFVDDVGFLNSFGIYGALLGFFSLGAIPVYLYGEKIRGYLSASRYAPRTETEI